MTTIQLSNGYSIPAVGFGTYQSDKVPPISKAIEFSLQVGYKHFDCASIYGNEQEIGQVLGKCNRNNIFVTSKLWNDKHGDVHSAIDQTLKDLQLEYLDLYLMHWPVSQDPVTKVCKIDIEDIKQTWKEMEKLVDQGKARSIGVSNFTVDLLKQLLQSCRIKPVVNQVELHPYLPQNQLVQFCKENGIVLTGYSPLGGRPKPESIINDPVVADIAKRNGKTPAQVLISWGVQRGTCVIPKSSNEERIKSNFQVFQLSQKDFDLLNELGTSNPKRFINPKDAWKVDIFGE
ncbi:hypothetical protein HDV04_005934 [Boothiomyces sp. JEL0838]|nr:hypothetical protein HDV04_005934 [Boothiomyces sp. JEL0838]